MNVLKRGDTNIWLFLFVKSFGKLLFSVSRLWKISLFDCQVLWVQYKSTSMIYKRTIIGINFWNENAKKNPMFLKKELKILWRGNRSLTRYLTPKICRSTLLASMGKLYTLAVKYSLYKHGENIYTRAIFPLVSRYNGALPLILPAITFCKTAKRLSHKQCNKNEIADEQFCNFITVRKF